MRQGYECNYTAKEKLKHVVSKEAFNIDGLGKKVIDHFWNLKFIKQPSDIFNLNYDKIKTLGLRYQLLVYEGYRQI